MRSSSLGSVSGRMQIHCVKPQPENNSLENVDISIPAMNQCTRKSLARTFVILLYSAITVLDLVRGIIHAFLYEIGLNDISGLSTGDALTDGRLAALMIAYGGANLESFVVRSYVVYKYVRYNDGRDLIRVTSVACVVWDVTRIVSSIGNIDVGDAELPGKHAMLVRSILSFATLLLTFVS